MKEPGRLITAMVTPFSDEGKVDYVACRKLAAALVESGSEGIVLSGTTGEGPTLSKEEKIRLFSEVKSAVGARCFLIGGTGNYNTESSIELTKEAEKAGMDAALLVVPYYNKPTQDGLFEHFKAIARSTKLPCILYNVPGRTVTDLLPDTVVRLSQVDNIIGIKEASGKLGQVARIIDGVKKKFYVWSGNDEDTFPIVTLGGYGVISVISHLVGKQMREMIGLTLAGKVSEAAAIHHRLLPLVGAMFVISNPMPIKYALNCVGFKVGKPRLPLIEPDAKTAFHIKGVLSTYQIDLKTAD